ncbi:M20 family metallo-hydrolase [Archaeoglobus profundus]|uniref:Acetylornithine deacetylase or succinyl-diaminopimelate desuccinylase n=1 Tax=Archaeoglobus profundus (strain DSM 5631 / JCM 9629 / NBRC 100127 / Av18) TaxID=572546 RepID=D2RER0_ARCPA|nr:M20 family metallo-hydrolase [Archaeoglobus profundus]ADB58604.1 acetylornithine deacetylase or succinyl- diaminopimelate desuccinylase [Archaeoglobus profundus DSM 5631]
MKEEVSRECEKYREEMIEVACKLIELKAISPDYGGEGELDKAEYIESLLEGFEVERFDAKDDRAKGGVRPNIVAKVCDGERMLWIVSHMDVVPEGDLALWETPPFKAVVKDGKIYGRGAEDNNQAIVSSLFAGKVVKNLMKKGFEPKIGFGLVFVSDEETGSEYGIKYLLKQGIFNKDDLIVVPDAGNERGDEIEIAEKSVLWLKFRVHGIQSHASTPKLNANRRAMEFLLELDKTLHSKFSATNKLFNPPYSTFEPTKREKNVDNVNTVPGLDVSYMDCRVLPEYDLNDVLRVVNEVKAKFVERDKKPIEVEVLQTNSSPPTPEDSDVVEILRKAIKLMRVIDARPIGIGGNTCASFFRQFGIHTAVWATFVGNAHEPNEFCLIDNMVEDAKVFALLPFI